MNVFTYSQISIPENEAWEVGEYGHSLQRLNYRENEVILNPVDHFFIGLIKYYQSKISTNSISRCPFYLSCSNFTKRAIEKYGFLLGICFFIDRNQYRENAGMYSCYRKVLNKRKNIKLDDSFFISEKIF
jgi:putative component of membrane protein insertase Oxa1/YidC/SpoIIIJ protein YidD